LNAPHASWRAPTLLEASFLKAQTVSTAQPRAPHEALSDRRRIDVTLDHLVRDRKKDARQAAMDLQSTCDRSRLESNLAAAIVDAFGLRRRAAVSLLCELATVESLPLLWRLADEPDAGPLVRPALGRLAPPEQLAAFDARRLERAARGRMLADACRASRGRPVQENLMVISPETESIAATKSPAADPVVAALLQQLSDRRVDTRLSAARELARRDDPAVVQMLVRLVENNISRREALLALASSKCPEARAFLEQAQSAHGLAGPIRSVIAQAKNPQPRNRS
jgi:HEAT repeat protein